MTREQLNIQIKEQTTEIEALQAQIEALQSGQSAEAEKLKTALSEARQALATERRQKIEAEASKAKPKSLWAEYNSLEGAERTAFWRENKAAMAAEVGRV